jgi:hypothetical protein
MYKRENSAERKGIEASKYVSAAGIRKLCQAICPELVAYKKIVEYADNLRPEEVEETFRELDERCGLSVDATCGVDFQYRAIKEKKKILKLSTNRDWHKSQE